MTFIVKGTVAAANAAMVEIEKDEGGYLELRVSAAVPRDVFNKMASGEIKRVEVECERWDRKNGPMPSDQGYNERGIRIVSLKPL